LKRYGYFIRYEMSYGYTKKGVGMHYGLLGDRFSI